MKIEESIFLDILSPMQILLFFSLNSIYLSVYLSFVMPFFVVWINFLAQCNWHKIVNVRVLHSLKLLNGATLAGLRLFLYKYYINDQLQVMDKRA